MSTNPNPIQQAAPAPQAAAQTQPTPDTQDNGTVSLPDDDGSNAVAGSQKLARAFSKLNEALLHLADQSGVRRSATVPHIDGQGMDSHINAVGQAVAGAGGLTKNLLIATHSKHAADGGSTAAYPADKLKEVIIPKDDKNAAAAIAACRSFVNKAAALLGDDDPTVKTAKSQLDLIGKADGAQMTAQHLIVALLNVPAPIIQAIARAHSFFKHGKSGHPALTAPRQ